MRKLDRLGWAEGLAFTAFGVRVGVRLNVSGMLPGILPLLPFERPANACTFDEWAETLRGICGCFHPILGDGHEFSGWALRRRIGGLDALDAGIGVEKAILVQNEIATSGLRRRSRSIRDFNH